MQMKDHTPRAGDTETLRSVHRIHMLVVRSCAVFLYYIIDIYVRFWGRSGPIGYVGFSRLLISGSGAEFTCTPPSSRSQGVDIRGRNPYTTLGGECVHGLFPLPHTWDGACDMSHRLGIWPPSLQ